jgi:hypothetical protein
MKWTQAHSKSAVAAKARKRIERALAEPEWQPGKSPVPRKTRAVVTIQVRCHEIGDSITLNLHRAPWKNQWLCELGQFSSAHLGRALAIMLKAHA